MWEFDWHETCSRIQDSLKIVWKKKSQKLSNPHVPGGVKANFCSCLLNQVITKEEEDKMPVVHVSSVVVPVAMVIDWLYLFVSQKNKTL